jgi:hypothetical protein
MAGKVGKEILQVAANIATIGLAGIVTYDRVTGSNSNDNDKNKKENKKDNSNDNKNDNTNKNSNTKTTS